MLYDYLLDAMTTPPPAQKAVRHSLNNFTRSSAQQQGASLLTAQLPVQINKDCRTALATKAARQFLCFCYTLTLSMVK